MMRGIDTGRWAGPGLSLLRIVTGLLFMEHGTSKLLDFPHVDMPMAITVGSLPWIGGLLELVGGALLVIGLFSRIAAFILAGEMAVAYWMFHAPQSPFPVQNSGDAAILYCFIFLAIAAMGPGPWSVDAAMRTRRIVETKVDEGI
ncbi:MAG: DoxX family protein [Sphingomonas sp.]|uniref:DoxX family protein n=1 Tax=Sphingomonas sp. TaxID=28214 RepID=UPI0017A21632|nr:DoxX family protein [Sphingomonas sp.]MBA3667068.1 DoxX family protein [Sphingomonas sp.]